MAIKSKIEDLAVFGGQSAFAAKLHVGRPNLGDRQQLMQRINEMLDRRWLTNQGVLVTEFERRVAALAGSKHCIATCNATIALELAIRAAGMKGEVIVPSFTFVATAHAVQWQEITPVFCDIDPATHTLDPNRVEEMITPRTTGIIGVHLWGRACAVDELTEIARRHNLALLFDAAHAFRCTHKGQPLGQFGLAAVFSFHATKFLNTGEGGAIVTNDDDFAYRARLMTNFGFVDYDKVIYIGTNGKMQEVSAAMGLTNLEAMDEFVAINRRNYSLYAQRIAEMPGVKVFPYRADEQSNYQYVVVEMDAKKTGVTRDELVRILHAENIIARRYFYPGVHRMEPYRSYFPHAGLLLPQTEKLCEEVLVLPTGTAVTQEDISKVCEVMHFALENATAIRSRLANGNAAGK